CQQHNFYPYTF
nr:immunoglobulin light chain junction region [Macaca mulatta]MOV62650.1 immunoglobulin light chain junction region [Macaca mulatta]MOV63409.1 immunoglobulin light chain junction region [Macaca mulatta]MOV63723.1 immunoglobulin light chain junction region [Macaca mulatta]MOV64575.1 immunoglobulin light chain junction region [Macaca mulatta]